MRFGLDLPGTTRYWRRPFHGRWWRAVFSGRGHAFVLPLGHRVGTIGGHILTPGPFTGGLMFLYQTLQKFVVPDSRLSSLVTKEVRGCLETRGGLKVQELTPFGFNGPRVYLA